jgi:DNA-binding winged helix-turn-helix (wHTH) protein
LTMARGPVRGTSRRRKDPPCLARLLHHPRIMMARVRSSTSEIRTEFVLDMATRELRRGTLPVHVEPKVFDLIALLVRQSWRVVETREISAELWANENVCDGALRQCVWSARRALRDSAKESQFIRTVHRWGYRFVGHVAVESETLLRFCGAISTDAYDVPARGSAEGSLGIEHAT